METLPNVRDLKPVGGKRSSKREQILNVFLRQEGHLSADDLFDLIRREDQRISRATVYRTLQWMVEAGIARKVDFGEGRFRFEHSYRHPRHYHLICKTCNHSSEFLSSDIEALVDEVAAARNFATSQSVVQIYGTCEECRTGKHAGGPDGYTELLFARDALRIAIATERSGLEFYTRAARSTRDARGRKVFQSLAEEEKHHLGTLEARYRELLERDPQLESRPTFLFFKGAANGLFADGAALLAKGVDDQQALLIGIKCERGSHKFFKKYGERFEDSEGKQIFLEFADEEREHLDLLIREYRALVKRQGLYRNQPRRRVGPAPTGDPDPRFTTHDPRLVIDLHMHTTASDGRFTPERLVEEASRAGLTTIAVTDHDTVAATFRVAAACAKRGIEAVAGVEITAIERGRDVHILGYLFDVAEPSLYTFLARQRKQRLDRVGAIADRLESLGKPIDRGALLASGPEEDGHSIGRPQIARAMVAAGHVDSVNEAFEQWLGGGKPAFVPRPAMPVSEVIAAIHRAGGIASLAHPGETRVDDEIPRMRDAGLDALEVYHSEHSTSDRERYLRLAEQLQLLVTGGSDFHADPEHGIELGSVSLPQDAWDRLKTWPRRS